MSNNDDTTDQHKDAEEQIFVTTLFGAESNLPLVTIHMRGQTVQLTVDAARDLALNILQASEAAIADGLMWTFVERLGLNETDRAFMMRDFRELRRQWEVIRKTAEQEENTN
jgi:hypothetical protein